MRMLFGSYRFLCRFKDDAQLPIYKGSTFRGVFGRALKNVICTQKSVSNCNDCNLKNRCLYVLVFETNLLPKIPHDAHSAGPPHPFVIEPPLETRTNYRSGETFDFNLLLFGNINYNLPYFIYAFEKMGTIGIGRSINGRRGRFLLEKVSCREETVYTRSDKFLVTNGLHTDLNVQSLPESTRRPGTLHVQLHTPLRIKFNNQYNKAELPFHLLVRACLRRISILMNYYGDGEPALDYSRLAKHAMDVTGNQDNLQWYDWRRYSFRQEKDMLMGGMVGEVRFNNVPVHYLPLLKFAERTHIGKQTAFGLGKIETLTATE
jgi:hypothetical protein